MSIILAVGLATLGAIIAGGILVWVVERLIRTAPVQPGEYSSLDRRDGRRL